MHGSYQMVNTIRIGSSGQVREDQKPVFLCTSSSVELELEHSLILHASCCARSTPIFSANHSVRIPFLSGNSLLYPALPQTTSGR
jgi:hypothetical protein